MATRETFRQILSGSKLRVTDRQGLTALGDEGLEDIYHQQV